MQLGVPIEAIKTKIAIIAIDINVTLYLELTATNIAAIISIMAVPSIFTVIPNGKTKDAI